jgi:hypothetical protein
MAALQRRLLMERSAEERLEMGCAMFDTARALMRAGLGIPPGAHLSPDMRVRLFLRTYGRDFDAATAARIIAHLGGPPADPGECPPAALPAGPGRPPA